MTRLIAWISNAYDAWSTRRRAHKADKHWWDTIGRGGGPK